MAVAKVTILNTREHEITLSARDKSGAVRSVEIPRATPNTEDPSQPFNPGVAEIDGELFGEARKKAAVAGYFDAGWLKVQKGTKEKADAGQQQNQ